jgi:hypothetical protein
MRAFALLIAAHALVACSYAQYLGDPGDAGAGDAGTINCAANPGIELVVDLRPSASLQIDPMMLSSLASDGTNLYWSVWGYPEMGGGVWQAPISGGDPMWLTPNVQNGGANGLAVDATSIYWTHQEGVTSMPIGGGTPRPIAAADRASGIALDATNVYWTSLGEGSVMKVPIGGGDATVLASGQSEPAAIAVDAANVYWRNSGDGTIKKVPIGGGDETLLASGLALSSGMAVAGGHLYWTNYDDGTVMTVPTSGGTPTTLASGQPGPGAIATDGTNVYFSAEGGVRRVPVGGGAPITIECEHEGARMMAIDATHLYWPSGGGIVRYPR